AGPGPPPDLERRPPGRGCRGGQGAEGRPLRAVEEPRGLDPPAARQAGPHRRGQPAAVPGVSVERGAAAGLRGQRATCSGAAGRLAGMVQTLPEPAVSRVGQEDRPAPGRDRRRLDPGAVQRAGRIPQSQDPPADSGRVRVPLAPGADLPGNTRPGRAVPGSARTRTTGPTDMAVDPEIDLW